MKLRFFSIRVVLDQRSLDYGDDVKEFMRRQIELADAVIMVITEDYNRALAAESGPGEGVRFEVAAALREKATRPTFQIIPFLLDGVRPVAPFDQMNCAVPERIDDIAVQLGLAGFPRVLSERYRIDKLVEQRGLAVVYHAWDMVGDLPVEAYLVAPASEDLKHRYEIFERVVRGRASVSSPFLLNVRDTYIDSQGGFYLVTERFEGRDLGVWLGDAQRTHPFGSICLAFQVALALYELHSVGVVHGGLALRCIRLNMEQTCCKITDFEFATPREFVGRTADSVEGYLNITPPERFRGSSVSVAQDVYQVGNMIVRLLCGRPARSRANHSFAAAPEPQPLAIEEAAFRDRLSDEILHAVADSRWMTFESGSAWLNEKIRATCSKEFVLKELVPFLTWCLAPNPADRPKNCRVLSTALANFGVPVVGHLVDPDGVPVVNGLFR